MLIFFIFYFDFCYFSKKFTLFSSFREYFGDRSRCDVRVRCANDTIEYGYDAFGWRGAGDPPPRFENGTVNGTVM